MNENWAVQFNAGAPVWSVQFGAGENPGTGGGEIPLSPPRPPESIGSYGREVSAGQIGLGSFVPVLTATFDWWATCEAPIVGDAPIDHKALAAAAAQAEADARVQARDALLHAWTAASFDAWLLSLPPDKAATVTAKNMADFMRAKPPAPPEPRLIRSRPPLKRT